MIGVVNVTHCTPTVNRQLPMHGAWCEKETKRRREEEKKRRREEEKKGRREKGKKGRREEGKKGREEKSLFLPCLTIAWRI